MKASTRSFATVGLFVGLMVLAALSAKAIALSESVGPDQAHMWFLSFAMFAGFPMSLAVEAAATIALDGPLLALYLPFLMLSVLLNWTAVGAVVGAAASAARGND